MRFFFVLLFFVTTRALAFAPAPFVPNVVDETGTLSPTQIADVNSRIQNLRERADVWAAVYLVRTIGTESIESVAETTFEKWSLGEKGKDNGILLLFVIDDRNARIEVGYGLEGDVTDAHSKRILDGVILPHFKEGNFAKGIASGIETIGFVRTKDESFLDPALEIPISPREIMTGDDFDWERSKTYWLTWIALLFGLPIFIDLVRTFKTGKKLSGFSTLVFGEMKYVRVFLAVNPGVFIAFLGPMFVDSAIPYLEREYARGAFDWQLRTWTMWAIGFFALPVVVRTLGYVVGRSTNRKNPTFSWSLMRKFSFLTGLDSIFGTIFLCVLAGIGSFIAGMTNLDLAVYVVAGTLGTLTVVFVVRYQWTQVFLPLASEQAYGRKLARERLSRIKARSTGTRTIFGKTYTHTPTSRSSGSGSSGRTSGSSSSSGGGRSGGGGASSRW